MENQKIGKLELDFFGDSQLFLKVNKTLHIPIDNMEYPEEGDIAFTYKGFPVAYLYTGDQKKAKNLWEKFVEYKKKLESKND